MRRRSTALCDHAAMPNLRFLPLALLASSAFALVWGGHVLLQLHGPPVAASSATLSEHEMEQINAMAPQDQVTRLLERTINHYKGAADEIAKRTDGWTGKIHSTADLQTMTNTAYFSNDLRVRAAALEIWLAEYNLRKNSATVDELIRDAAAGGDRKYFLLSNLGILGNRGVEPEKGIFSINRGRLRGLPRRTEIHGFGSLLDRVRQGGHLHRSADPVADVLKEVHSQFPGGAEQCFHGVPGPGASQRARTVAYHSLPDSCPRVQFCRVVVQRDLGMIQHHQQVRFVGPSLGDPPIQFFVTRHCGKQFVELLSQRHRPLRRGSLLVSAQLFVEFPVALAKRFQPFTMLRHARRDALIMPPVANPA